MRVSTSEEEGSGKEEKKRHSCRTSKHKVKDGKESSKESAVAGGDASASDANKLDTDKSDVSSREGSRDPRHSKNISDDEADDDEEDIDKRHSVVSKDDDEDDSDEQDASARGRHGGHHADKHGGHAKHGKHANKHGDEDAESDEVEEAKKAAQQRRAESMKSKPDFSKNKDGSSDGRLKIAGKDVDASGMLDVSKLNYAARVPMVPLQTLPSSGGAGGSGVSDAWLVDLATFVGTKEALPALEGLLKNVVEMRGAADPMNEASRCPMKFLLNQLVLTTTQALHSVGGRAMDSPAFVGQWLMGSYMAMVALELQVAGGSADNYESGLDALRELYGKLSDINMNEQMQGVQTPRFDLLPIRAL